LKINFNQQIVNLYFLWPARFFASQKSGMAVHRQAYIHKIVLEQVSIDYSETETG